MHVCLGGPVPSPTYFLLDFMLFCTVLRGSRGFGGGGWGVKGKAMGVVGGM